MSTTRVLDRVVPAAWLERLAAVSPKSEGLAWLHPVWVAGETPEIDGQVYNAPVERWVLYQIQPIQYVAPAALRELQGPHPRSTGQWRPYRRDDGTMGAAWFGGPCKQVTRQQWELYRETGGFALPWWVIQGDKGGHRVALNPAERLLYAAEWGVDPADVDVPRMGALPYADFDERVIDAIQQHDHLAQFGGMAGVGSRYGDFLMRAMAAKEEQARAKAYDDVYVATADEFADELSWTLRRDDPAWRPVVTDERSTFDADAARESYIAGVFAMDTGHVDQHLHTPRAA